MARPRFAVQMSHSNAFSKVSGFMDITVIDDSDAAGWITSALRFGEIYISDLADMVTKVTRAAGGTAINSITVYDHGSARGFEIGSDWVSSTSISGFSADFARIGAQIASAGHFHLKNCQVGANTTLLQRLAAILGVSVYATPNVTNAYGLNTGYTQYTGLGGGRKGIPNPFESFELYYRFDPDGTVDRDAGSP